MGLVVLYPDENNAEINARLGLDIVAVHGLNGHQIRTWTEPTSEKLWLRDFLPRDIPLARIMTFGYDASPLTNTDATTKEHAIDLLRSIATVRTQSSSSERPLLFMGHSLGGIVIKTALLTARENNQIVEGYKDIDDSTIGIIFYGTPHKGSEMATLAEKLSRAPKYVTTRNRSTLLKTLRKGSVILKKLEDDFLAHEWHKPYKFVSFYETKKTMGFSVVEKSSAVLNQSGSISFHEEQVPVASDHRDICRYASKDDETYLRSVESIKQICKETIAPPPRHEYYVVPHTVNKNFTGREDILQRLKSCLIDSQYLPQKSQQRFVLYGLGGSGKTQICLKFIQDHKNSFSGVFWIDASSVETIEKGFRSIGTACKQEEDTNSVRAWLSTRSNWLLVMDNADDPRIDVSKFFPEGSRGTIIVTSRILDSRKHATSELWWWRVDQMDPEDAITLLLRASLESPNDPQKRALAKPVVECLGFFALAIVQAAAVLREQVCSLGGFCELYGKQKRQLLEQSQTLSDIDYHYSVYTTWEISTQKIKEMEYQYAPLALELLDICSFFHFDTIRRDIFKRSQTALLAGAPYFRSSLTRLMPDGWDDLVFSEALRILSTFSLINITESEDISIHPLVHEWSRDRLHDDERFDRWSIAAYMLEASIYQDYENLHSQLETQYRKYLIPHIDACIASANGPWISLRSINVALIAASFATAYYERGRYEEAISIDEKQCEVLKNLPDLPFDTRRYLIAPYANLAVCHSEMGHLEDAVKYRKMAIEIAKESFGEDSREKWAECANLTLNLLDAGEIDQALALGNEAYMACTRLFSSKHLTALQCRSLVGRCYVKKGRFKDAIPIYEEVLDLYTKEFGSLHTHTIGIKEYLAQAYIQLNQFKKAADLHEEIIAGRTTVMGEGHPVVLWTLDGITTFLELNSATFIGKRGALRYRKVVFEKMQDKFGYHDMHTMICLEQLAEDYFYVGRLNKAKNMQIEALNFFKENYGDDSELTKDAVSRLEGYRKYEEIRRGIYWWVPKKYIQNSY